MSQASDAIKAKREMDNHTVANRSYFEQAIKYHGMEGKGDAGDADYLLKDYQKNTQGLDQEVAMQALEGGRQFGKSDKARYDKLMAERSSAKEKAQNFTAGSNNNVDGTGNAVGIGNTATTGNTGDVTDSPGAAVGIGNVAGGGNEVNGSGNATGVGNNANTQENIGNTSQTVTQDNDQTSTVTGDNNYVNQQQDNSVRNYGGDNRVFNYQGGSGKDSPVSAATMAGYFAPNDSHSANAARLDRQSTQNRDLQKAYQNTSNIAQGAIARAQNNSYIDPAALDKRIADREQYSRSKSTVMGLSLIHI